MFLSPESRMSLLLAGLLTAWLMTGCDRTTAPSLDAAGEIADVRDAGLREADVGEADAKVTMDAADDRGVDVALDASVARDADADVIAPFPEAAACGRGADVRVVVSPDVNLSPEVFESCQTRLPTTGDAGRCERGGVVGGCTCADGHLGQRMCRDDQWWGTCRCNASDAGADAPIWSDGPIPRIEVPRLLAPQSGTRATSQRPTFRWVLPSGVTRARVQVCAERACARMLAQGEAAGTSWRPVERLPPGVAFWKVHGLADDGSVSWTSATWEVGIRHRDLSTDTSYGNIHDFNGDGYDDAVVYSDESRSEYRLRVYAGGSDGLRADRFRGINPPYRMGTSVYDGLGFGSAIAIGDVNGDGLTDLVLGESGFGPLGAVSRGHVLIYMGARDQILPACSQELSPPRLTELWSYGENVSAGDFNGDGYDDVIAQYGGWDKVQLHLGGPSGTDYLPVDSFGEASPRIYGFSFIGDANMDGYADIAVRVGEFRDSTQIALLYGNPEAALRFHIQGPLRSRFLADFYGHQMVWGDYNSDGIADAIIAGAGYADVYHGSERGLELATRLPTPPSTALGLDAFTAFANSISYSGDLDGDGMPEVAIGARSAPYEEGHPGMGLVFIFGSTERGLPLIWDEVLTTATNGGGFSFSAIPGDLNADGFDDLLIGAPGGSEINPYPELHIYLGATDEWWCEPTLVMRGRRSRGFAGIIE